MSPEAKGVAVGAGVTVVGAILLYGLVLRPRLIAAIPRLLREQLPSRLPAMYQVVFTAAEQLDLSEGAARALQDVAEEQLPHVPILNPTRAR